MAALCRPALCRALCVESRGDRNRRGYPAASSNQLLRTANARALRRWRWSGRARRPRLYASDVGARVADEREILEGQLAGESHVQPCAMRGGDPGLECTRRHEPSESRTFLRSGIEQYARRLRANCCRDERGRVHGCCPAGVCVGDGDHSASMPSRARSSHGSGDESLDAIEVCDAGESDLHEPDPNACIFESELLDRFSRRRHRRAQRSRHVDPPRPNGSAEACRAKRHQCAVQRILRVNHIGATIYGAASLVGFETLTSSCTSRLPGRCRGHRSDDEILDELEERPPVTAPIFRHR